MSKRNLVETSVSMIAMFTTSKSLSHVVQYNEQKVETGKARLLAALGFSSPADQLSLEEKVFRLERQVLLNKRVRIQCVHITLNFDVGEKLEPSLYASLAADYLRRIGFGEQPCLVYQHLDAAHPHLHLVTTHVDANGKVIPINDIVRKGSLQATLEMEKQYDLQRTHQQKDWPVTYELQPAAPRLLEEAPAPPVEYGQTTMGPAMARVLERVLGSYQFTSLEEFNALLRPYRIEADRGRPGSPIYTHGGLIYKALGEDGKQVGNYIKASHLPGKPTLAYLEGRFSSSLPAREIAADRIRTLVGWTLLPETGLTLSRLRRELDAEGIETRWNNPGSENPTVIYIDHKSRWAVSEVNMGTGYGATDLMAHCKVERQDLEQALSQSFEAKKTGYARELLLYAMLYLLLVGLALIHLHMDL